MTFGDDHPAVLRTRSKRYTLAKSSSTELHPFSAVTSHFPDNITGHFAWLLFQGNLTHSLEKIDLETRSCLLNVVLLVNELLSQYNKWSSSK